MPGTRGQSRPFSVSQNFLTSHRTIWRLVGLTSLTKNDTVVEIGAGKGHITGVLAQTCGHVLAAEIDGKLFDTLKSRLSGAENVSLRQGDFLKMALPTRKYKVFSNIPFSITTDILRKLTQCPNPPEDAWLLVEKGAALRFCGLPRETVSSLALKPFFETEIVCHLRREDFHPMPGVDVVMLHLKKRHAPDIAPQRRQAFERFVRTGLSGRRLPLTDRQAKTALRQAGLSVPERSDTMRYVQWLCLFRCLK